MPFKERYTISDEVSLSDDQVVWPNGNRCCVSVVVDLSPASGPQGLSAGDLRSPEAIFGLNEGLDQVLAVLQRFDVKATVTVPAALVALLAGRLRDLRAAGHEIAAQGFSHEDVSALSPEQEKARLDRTTAIFNDVLGGRPDGWYGLPRQGDPFAVGTVSADTVDLLIDAGYRYLGNGLSDDIPHYWVTDLASRRAMLTMPYYYHFDDQFFLMFPRKGSGLENPDMLFANWVAEFDAQYKRGRYFGMTLHPYAIGWCNRLKLLEDFFGHMRARPGLWNPTAGQCADYWLKTYPASSHLRLEPSIWQEYPGSLN